MLKKYNTIRQDTLEYIHNRLQAGASVKQVIGEVETKFPTAIAFFKADPEMRKEAIEWVVAMAYYLLERKFHDQ